MEARVSNMAIAIKIGDEFTILTWHYDDRVSGPYYDEDFCSVENVTEEWAYFGGSKSGKFRIADIEVDEDGLLFIDSIFCEFDKPDARQTLPDVYAEFADLYEGE